MTLQDWPSDKPLDLAAITPTEAKTALTDMKERGERIAAQVSQGLIEVDQLNNFLKDLGKALDLAVLLAGKLL